MNIHPHRSPFPALGENRPADRAREPTAAEAALAVLALHESHSNLAGHAVMPVALASGSAAAASDTVLELLAPQLIATSRSMDAENVDLMKGICPAPARPAAEKAARQQIYDDGLLAWEAEHGQSIREMRGLDVDGKTLALDLQEPTAARLSLALSQISGSSSKGLRKSYAASFAVRLRSRLSK